MQGKGDPHEVPAQVQDTITPQTFIEEENELISGQLAQTAGRRDSEWRGSTVVPAWVKLQIPRDKSTKISQVSIRPAR